MRDLSMIKPKENEDFITFRDRITENKNVYGLTWKNIKKLCYDWYGVNVSDNWRKFTYIKNEKEISNIGFDNSIMIINDIHVPFERDDILEIISEKANEITTLIIGGDFMDCKAVSSFPNINRGEITDELIYAYGFIKKIRLILNNNQKIIIMNGNHEDRWKMTIAKMHEKGLQKFINPNLISMIVDGFSLYLDGKRVNYKAIEGITYIPHWYVVVDDLIVCHPKDFSRVKGKMLENVTSYFINQEIDFSTVVFGHTHKYSCGVIDRFQGKFALENPCMCKPHSYSDCGKLGYSPQSYGYTIIKYNKNERIDPNNITTYLLRDNKQYTNNYTVEI